MFALIKTHTQKLSIQTAFEGIVHYNIHILKVICLCSRWNCSGLVLGKKPAGRVSSQTELKRSLTFMLLTAPNVWSRFSNTLLFGINLENNSQNESIVFFPSLKTVFFHTFAINLCAVSCIESQYEFCLNVWMFLLRRCALICCENETCRSKAAVAYQCNFIWLKAVSVCSVCADLDHRVH